MEVMFDRVAGLDVGKDSVTVCIRTLDPRGCRRSETRTFKTVFGSLRVMRDWHALTGTGMHRTGMHTSAAKLLPRMIKTLSSLHRKGLWLGIL
jgi:hypothetical protein